MSDSRSVFPHPERHITRQVRKRPAFITFFIVIYFFPFEIKNVITVQSQPPKCYAFYTCFMKFYLALNSCKIWLYYILILFCIQEKPCCPPYCYCSHDVRPATHIGIHIDIPFTGCHNTCGDSIWNTTKLYSDWITTISYWTVTSPEVAEIELIFI